MALESKQKTIKLGNKDTLTLAYTQDHRGRDEITLMRIDHGRASFITFPLANINSVTSSIKEMAREISIATLKKG